MDFWIRSQDREELIPIKTKLKINEGDFVQVSIKPYITERQFAILHGTDFLGEYKNKERALEVLDEIEHYACHSFRLDINGCTTYCNSIIYRMPKE